MRAQQQLSVHSNEIRVMNNLFHIQTHEHLLACKKDPTRFKFNQTTKQELLPLYNSLSLITGRKKQTTEHSVDNLKDTMNFFFIRL